jgi:hypothetical protein
LRRAIKPARLRIAPLARNLSHSLATAGVPDVAPCAIEDERGAAVRPVWKPVQSTTDGGGVRIAKQIFSRRYG